MGAALCCRAVACCGLPPAACCGLLPAACCAPPGPAGLGRQPVHAVCRRPAALRLPAPAHSAWFVWCSAQLPFCHPPPSLQLKAKEREVAALNSRAADLAGRLQKAKDDLAAATAALEASRRSGTRGAAALHCGAAARCPLCVVACMWRCLFALWHMCGALPRLRRGPPHVALLRTRCHWAPLGCCCMREADPFAPARVLQPVGHAGEVVASGGGRHAGAHCVTCGCGVSAPCGRLVGV